MHVFILPSDLSPPAPVGLDGDGDRKGGGRDSWSGPERLCVCVCLWTHMLTHACVCMCVVATAYPFRIHMKLNQHFSFVFGVALQALRGPLKDI